MELDAVLSGGGVKGIALVGALSVFEEAGYQFVRHAGTSAGAIVGGLHAAGYSAAELRTEWVKLNLRRRLFDTDRRDVPAEAEPAAESNGASESIDLMHIWGGLKARFRVKNGGQPVAPKRLGIFSGSGFESFFRSLLARKGVHTFKDLRLPDGPGGKPRYRVEMVAADITRGRLVLLPHDIIHYDGFPSPDDLDVALAMRISMSIPAIFRPVPLRRKRSKKTCYLVDGAILSQFPIAYFQTHGFDERPAIGFRLKRPEDVEHMVRVHGPVSLLLACALTALEAHDAQLAETEDWQTRTVMISGLNIPDINFLLSDEQKVALYDSGVAAARAFLENPASRAYLERPRGIGPFQFL